MDELPDEIRRLIETAQLEVDINIDDDQMQTQLGTISEQVILAWSIATLQPDFKDVLMVHLHRLLEDEKAMADAYCSLLGLFASAVTGLSLAAGKSLNETFNDLYAYILSQERPQS